MKRLNTYEFIKMAKGRHGDTYDYSISEYTTARKKIKIICRKHGVFLVSPDNHIRNKSGCPSCAIQERLLHRIYKKHHDHHAKTIEKRSSFFWNSVRQVHGDKYDYSLAKFSSNHAKIKIICKKHGDFSVMAGKFKKGQGCPKCCFEKRRSSVDDIIKRAIKKHGETYNYSEVDYVGFNVPVKIICSKHGMFLQTPNKHLFGHGCPICRKSKGEKTLIKWLISKNIKFEMQKTFSKCKNPITNRCLFFDFYIPSVNTCIEFDGEQHYGEDRRKFFDFKSIKYRDNIKDNFCKSNGICLFRIRKTDLTSLDQVLGSVSDPFDKYDMTAQIF
jgi:very-short-patch-repair endonuclease